VARDQIAIVRNVVGEQSSEPLDVVAPIAVQLASLRVIIACVAAYDIRHLDIFYGLGNRDEQNRFFIRMLVVGD
jgi:hypothetical protein